MKKVLPLGDINAGPLRPEEEPTSREVESMEWANLFRGRCTINGNRATMIGFLTDCPTVATVGGYGAPWEEIPVPWEEVNRMAREIRRNPMARFNFKTR